MEKLTIKSILVPTLSLFVICFVTALLLCGTNLLTKDKISSQTLKAEASSRKSVLPEAVSFKQETFKNGKFKYFVGINEHGNVAGYVFSTEAKGYGGTIEVITGINTLGVVENVKILNHSETPGLGANVASTEFLNKFNIPIGTGYFSVTKKAPTNNHEIEAVTGATISSTAVTKAVNTAVENYNTVIKNEGRI